MTKTKIVTLKQSVCLYLQIAVYERKKGSHLALKRCDYTVHLCDISTRESRGPSLVCADGTEIAFNAAGTASKIALDANYIVGQRVNHSFPAP